MRIPLRTAQPDQSTPWYRTMRRCGQLNFNEHDRVDLNIEDWLAYWSSLRINALLLNAGGMVAFYPTCITHRHKSQYLDGRDLFGDFAKPANKRGIRVVARLDCNYLWEEAWNPHPEWFEPVRNDQSPWLLKICLYSTYLSEQMPRTGSKSIWDCAQQGRVAQSVIKGRTITNFTGSYANSHWFWRHTSEVPEEATMWLAHTTASGMAPWYHRRGGAPPDRRWREAGRRFFAWIAEHERHFVNRESIANIGVVFSARTNAFYKPPGGSDPGEFLQGLYSALLRTRYPFNFVYQQNLFSETLKKYAVLLLWNVALLSDGQCRQIEAYAAGGGSLLSTFETSMYDERRSPRVDFGLSKLFGISRTRGIEGPNGNSYYARTLRNHQILRGFESASPLPGAEFRVPVLAPGAEPVLAVVPPFPAYPPEMVYPRSQLANEPAIVLRETGASRLAYIPGDVDRSFSRSGNPDLSRLIRNKVSWLVRERTPVLVEGAGMLEVFARETGPGFALHRLNHTSPNMLRGWFTSTYPVGAPRVRAELPETIKGDRVELLRAGTTVGPLRNGRLTEFTVARVPDYEVA